nr:reverse transcriptase domain-containing protein [Tanacetum cinerariifolium]
MRTRSKSYSNNSNATIPRRSNRRRVLNIVEPEIHTIVEVVPMADRTMKELLQAPTEGYGEAIVIPKILAENFEIKTNLLQLFQTNKFHGFERDNPHTHISNFKWMTSTLKYKDVPNDAIKIMLFSYSLEGAARIWDSSSKTDDIIDKLTDQILNLVEIVNKQVITPATTKAVEKTWVICGAGSESRPPMLNKENYVPWLSRLLWYAKSRPNGKLIHNSILNGPYFRRMIAEPGDGERDVNVNETFHEQTDDELSDDQAIQTILLGLPEDIYVAVDSCETTQEIWLRVQQMMKGHFARDCTVRPRRRDAAYLQTQLLIAQKEEAGIQLQAEEYDLMAAAADLDEIEEVNAKCILMANLQQASSSGTQTDSAPLYDSDG